MTVIFPLRDKKSWDSIYINELVVEKVVVLKDILDGYYYGIENHDEFLYVNKKDLIGPPVIVTE